MESPLVKKQRRNGNCPLSQDLILQEILPRLPTNSVIKFKSMSKSWLTLISQHASVIAAAATEHHRGEKSGNLITGRYRTDKYPISDRLFFLGHNELNPVEIDISCLCKKTAENVVLIGSCNGLVCLKLIHSYGKLHDLVVWNPATREVNYLLTGEPCSWITYYALAYDATSGVEKVLRWEDSFIDGRSIEAKIFSKKSGHWKRLKPYTRTDPEGYFFWDKNYSLTVDGVIYWKLKPYKVMSFHLSKGVFREFEGPITDLDHGLGDTFYYNLISWKGCLAAVFVKPGGTGIEVFLKNKDSINGCKTISTIQLSVRELHLGRLFRGDEIIPISYRDNSYGGKEILYDLVTQKKRDLGPVLEKLYCYYICQHFYTLNSPN